MDNANKAHPTRKASANSSGVRQRSSSLTRKRKRETSVEKSSSRQQAEEKPQRTILNRAGGLYVPPAKLRMLRAQITDKSSEEYQRIAWEELKKQIMGLINKVSVGNLPMVVRDLIAENMVRAKGLFVRSILQAQEFSQSFTHVYAAVVAVINTKFPDIGELVLKRLVVKFRNAYTRDQKQQCLAASRFIAHLTNQNVVDVVLALQIILKLLKDQTDDSIELAIGFLKECGQKLTEISPRSMHDVFESLRDSLQSGNIAKRTQYAIEVLLAIRKGGFKGFPAVIEELDVVDEAEQITHDMEIDNRGDTEHQLDVFRFDPEFEQNERRYQSIKIEILGNDDDEKSSDAEDGDDADDASESDAESEEPDDTARPIVVAGDGPTGPDQLRPETSATTTKIDKSEAKLISLRRTIYLTIQSSLEYEECAHKVMRLKLPDDEIEEVCHMILDCCAQQRTYEKFYGLLAQRFCLLKMLYGEHFQNIFKLTYDTIHRLETNKLRNVAKFFAHLLHTDSISWLVLGAIKLTEDDTTSAGRIFIKHLMQELAEYMGIPKLDERTKDVTLQVAFDGLFPRDHPRNTRFAINFFTAIGLGALTDDLREWLKKAPKQEPQLPVELQQIRDQQDLLLKPDTVSTSSGDDSSSASSSSSSSSPSSTPESRPLRKTQPSWRKSSTSKVVDRNSRRPASSKRSDNANSSRYSKPVPSRPSHRSRSRDDNRVTREDGTARYEKNGEDGRRKGYSSRRSNSSDRRDKDRVNKRSETGGDNLSRKDRDVETRYRRRRSSSEASDDSRSARRSLREKETNSRKRRS